MMMLQMFKFVHLSKIKESKYLANETTLYYNIVKKVF